jgi:cytochrome b
VSPPRSRFALYLDLWLLATVLLLFAPRLTGLPVHEWVGISLVPILVLHLELSWDWITSTTKTFPTRPNRRARINYLLNWLLFILIVLEITSGLMISQVALPPFGLATLDDRSWRALHNQALNWTHLVLGIHVAMNWQPLVLLARRYITSGARIHE